MAKQTKSSANKLQQDVRKFYELGCQVRDAPSEKRGKKIYDLGVVKRYAAQTGLSLNLIEKARMFARLYTQRDLEKLLSLETDGGVPLGRRHVTYLLSVKDKDRRRALQVRASEEAWSTRRLAVEIRQQQGKKSMGGRLPTLPVTAKEALIQIDDMSSHWIRWYNALSQLDKTDSDAVTWKQLPEGIRKRVQNELVPLLEQLRAQIRRSQNPRKRQKKTGTSEGRK